MIPFSRERREKRFFKSILIIFNRVTEAKYPVSADYAAEIMRKLREHEYDPKTMRLWIVGGGGCLIRNFGQYDPNRVTIIGDIHASAKGYEYLAERRLQREARAR